MCYYSFNYNTLILLTILIKCAAENAKINTHDHLDRCAYKCDILRQKCPGNLVLSILEYWNFISLLLYEPRLSAYDVKSFVIR